MRRLASMLAATAVLLGGTSLAIAQTTTTVVTTLVTPSYYSDYYRVPYFKAAPSRDELVKILVNAGYLNPTDLAINSDVWTGKATMENHQVNIRFDRQGIWQLTR
jgi:hypothetical protein